MEDLTEKRSCDRHYQEASISVAYFNTNRYNCATMLNYSEGGLYFESDLPFQPRTCVYIRIEEKMPGPPGGGFHNGFRSVALGEVKWCHEINKEKSGKYGVGVKFYELEY